MVAENNDFVRDVAWDDRVRIPDLLDLEVAKVFHGSNSIGARPSPVITLDTRHSALPTFTHLRRALPVSLQAAQQWCGIAVGYRQRGDLGQRIGFFGIEARGMLVRRLAGCRRVAGVERQCLHRSALDTGRLTSRAVRVRQVPTRLRHLSVLLGVRVNQASHCAALRCAANFQPTERSTVPDERDGSLKRDAGVFQGDVVFPASEVGVDNWCVRDAA